MGLQGHLHRTVLVFAAFVLLAGVVPSQIQASNPVIKVGWAVSLTGRLQVAGTSIHAGYLFWVETINNRTDPPGILIGNTRHLIQPVYYDDNSKVDDVKALYTKLITVDQVDFLLGPYSSGLNVHVVPIAHQYQKLMLISAASSRTVYNASLYAYSFGVPSTAAAYTTAILQDLANPKYGINTLFVAAENDVFSILAGQGALDYWSETLNMTNLAPMEIFSTCEAASAVNRIITNASSLDPDVFVVSGHYEESLLFAKSVIGEEDVAKGYRPRAVIFTSSGLTRLIDDLPHLNLDGIISPAEWHKNLDYTGELWTSAKEYDALFIEWLKTQSQDLRLNTAPEDLATNQWHAEASAAGLVLQLALTAAGTTDTAQTIAQLRQMDIQTFFGPIKFNVDGQNAGKPMAAVQLQGGQEVLVAPVGSSSSPLLFPLPFQDSSCNLGFFHDGEDVMINDRSMLLDTSLGGFIFAIIATSLLWSEVALVTFFTIKQGRSFRRVSTQRGPKHDSKSNDEGDTPSSLSNQGSNQWNEERPTLTEKLRRINSQVMEAPVVKSMVGWINVGEMRSKRSSTISSGSSDSAPCMTEMELINPSLSNYIQLLAIPAEAIQILAILLTTNTETGSNNLPWVNSSSVLDTISILKFEFSWFFWCLSSCVLLWALYFGLLTTPVARQLPAEQQFLIRLILMPSDKVLVLIPSLIYFPAIRVFFSALHCAVWASYSSRLLPNTRDFASIVLVDDCKMECWQGAHWGVAATGLILLLVFYPGSIASVSVGQTMQIANPELKLDIKYSQPFFAVSFTLKLILAWASIFLQSSQPYIFYSIAIAILLTLFLLYTLGRPCTVDWVSSLRAIIMFWLCLSAVICMVSGDTTDEDSKWPTILLVSISVSITVLYFFYDRKMCPTKFVNPGVTRRNQIAQYLHKYMRNELEVEFEDEDEDWEEDEGDVVEGKVVGLQELEKEGYKSRKESSGTVGIEESGVERRKSRKGSNADVPTYDRTSGQISRIHRRRSTLIRQAQDIQGETSGGAAMWLKYEQWSNQWGVEGVLNEKEILLLDTLIASHSLLLDVIWKGAAGDETHILSGLCALMSGVETAEAIKASKLKNQLLDGPMGRLGTAASFLFRGSENTIDAQKQPLSSNSIGSSTSASSDKKSVVKNRREREEVARMVEKKSVSDNTEQAQGAAEGEAAAAITVEVIDD
eukprot:Nk52_evm33s210 gene=Nk52_evmTU33s210